ncbi:MAG TPA: recombination mediator RecR [Victivallales bacterium]|nr:recombination mediator RecR [Victivallales bacterium]
MKNNLPSELENIISLLKELPGIGQRGAERMIFSILKWPPEKIKVLGKAISGIPENIKKCKLCGNISEEQICTICTSQSRDDSFICIVEDFIQIPHIEKTNYKGKYHVLEGKLSPLDNIGSENLTIKPLIQKIKNNPNLKEVIIALSQDIEGQATTIYLANLLNELNIKVSTLAKGIPAGADISFANSATLTAAINGRTAL